MKKKILWYGLFFAALLAGFYVFVFKDYNFSASKLKVINNNIPEFSFVDQDSNTVNTASFDNKVYVAEYFFTTCQGICPKMNTNMRRVWDVFRDEPDVAIISHTCMPEVDTIPLLKKYELKMVNGKLNQVDGSTFTLTPVQTDTAVNKNWYFVTGPKEELYKMARQGYMIDDGKPDSTLAISDQFIHTQFFALVDKYHRLRGIYDGLKTQEIDDLIRDIKDLQKEKVTTKRFMNGFNNNPG